MIRHVGSSGLEKAAIVLVVVFLGACRAERSEDRGTTHAGDKPPSGSNNVVGNEESAALIDLVQRKQAAARERFATYEARWQATLQTDSELDGLHNVHKQVEDTWERHDGEFYRIDSMLRTSGNIQFIRYADQILGSHQSQRQQNLCANAHVAARLSNHGKNDKQLRVWCYSDDLEARKHRADQLQRLRGVHLLDYAYGLKLSIGDSQNTVDLESTIDRLRRRGAIRAARTVVDRKEYIEIVGERDGENWLRVLIDPGKGFATVRVEFNWGGDEGVEMDGYKCDVSLKDIEDNLWAPHRITVLNDLTYDGHHDVSKLDVRVSAFEAREDLDPELFSWRSLEYTGDVFVSDETDDTVHMYALGRNLAPSRRLSEADTKRAEAFIAMLER